MENVTYDLACKCGAKLTILATLWPNFTNMEMVECPVCQQNIREIRTDVEYKIIKITPPA
jgi:hypothetical protein